MPANYNLSNLSDKDLVALEKRIKEEKENRKDSLMYKCNLPFPDERYKDSLALIEKYIKRTHPDFDMKNHFNHNNPVWRIQSSVYNICDYIIGNFKLRIDKLGTASIRCDGARLLIDNKEEYLELYNELYSVIDKWTEKKLKEIK